MRAPLPENEPERLAALRGLNILDTPPELAYDELSALAACICQTPIALISLVEEGRQWFKSRVGLTVGETPRELAFCAHAILEPDLLIVPDASTDERFANNPLVTSPPFIRFYAGAPLLTAEGHALGTICVIDHRPRQFSAEQAHALRALSHQVVAQLRLRSQLAEQISVTAKREQAEAELRRANERLALAVRGSNVGIWENDMAGGDYRAGRVRCINILEQLGYPGTESTVDYQTVEASIHADDRGPVEQTLRAYLAGSTPEYSVEFRAQHQDGSYRWMLSRGVVRGSCGRPRRKPRSAPESPRWGGMSVSPSVRGTPCEKSCSPVPRPLSGTWMSPSPEFGHSTRKSLFWCSKPAPACTRTSTGLTVESRSASSRSG
jgi:PAS domain-containing protein